MRPRCWTIRRSAPVCSGGRYDNLAEYYTDRQLPGVGISIGLTRLFYVLSEQEMLKRSLDRPPLPTCWFCR